MKLIQLSPGGGLEIFGLIYMAIMLFLAGLVIYVLFLVIKALKKYLGED